MSEMNEVMEINNEETMDTELMEINNEESGSGKGIAIVLAGLAAVGAAGALAYRKIKDKKNGKPRKKRKLMWVEVEDESVADVDTEVAEENTETEE